jgi:hypothetical protein
MADAQPGLLWRSSGSVTNGGAMPLIYTYDRNAGE